jgi:ribonuclease HI
MDLKRLKELETIDPRPLPPWRADSFTEIEIETDQETARERAETARTTSEIAVYSDAAGRENHLDAAVAALDENQEITQCEKFQVGPMDRWSVHIAELISIFCAINMLFRLAHQRSNDAYGHPIAAKILCDSNSALQSIQNTKNNSGQRIVHAILSAVAEVQAEGSALRLQWIPGHCEEPNNDAADRLAREAARSGKSQTLRPLLAKENAHIRIEIQAQWECSVGTRMEIKHQRRSLAEDRQRPTGDARPEIIRKPVQGGRTC